MKTPLENVLQEKYCDKADSFTVKHFQEEGASRSTLNQIWRRKEDEISAERQCGSGRPAKIMTNLGICFDHKCGISQRKVARQMKCTQHLVNWALKK